MNGDNRINNPIISNLTMSEEMKQNILDNCKRGKRTNDKLFRYSKLIVLFIALSCVCLGGLGTHAAISAVQNRMENMSDEEKDAYLEINVIGADAEWYTRAFTDTEVERLLMLQEEYKNGRFPEETILIVDKISDINDDQLAFVKEDGRIHLPKDEMTDEELLQLIDHDEKNKYTMETGIDEPNPYATGVPDEEIVLEESDIFPPTTVEATTEENMMKEADEEEKLEIDDVYDYSKEMVMKYFGVEMNDSWEYSVYQYDREGDAETKEWLDEVYPDYDVIYEVEYSKEGIINEGYQLTICGDNGRLLSINRGGSVIAPSYTPSMEEATEKIPVGKEIAIAYAEDVLGLDMDTVKLYGGFNYNVMFTKEAYTYWYYYLFLDANGDAYIIVWDIATEEISMLNFYWDFDEVNINSKSIKYIFMENPHETEVSDVKVEEDEKLEIDDVYDCSKEMVMKYFGVEMDDNWEYSVYQYDREGDESDKELIDLYYPNFDVVYKVDFSKDANTNEGYQLYICGDNGRLLFINHNGNYNSPGYTPSVEEVTEKIPIGKEMAVSYAEDVLGLDMESVKLYGGFNYNLKTGEAYTDLYYYLFLDSNGDACLIRWEVATGEIKEVQFGRDYNKENISSECVEYTLMEK